MDDNRLGRAIAAELGVLLDAVPASRRVLPHLAALEQVLKVEGLDGIDALPLNVLERANAQLSKLPLAPENVMLPQLLSLLEMAVQSRHHRMAPPPGARNEFLSSFMSEDKLTVDEVSHTEFALALEAQEKR